MTERNVTCWSASEERLNYNNYNKVNRITSADRGAPLPPSGPRCLTPR